MHKILGHLSSASRPSAGYGGHHQASMGFNKKLLLAGLAAGVTAYMLYRASKKKQQQQHIQAPAPYAAPAKPQSSHGGSHWGAAAGVAGVATAGAAYAAYNHHNNSSSSNNNSGQQQQHPYAAPPGANDVTWEMLRDWRHIANILSNCVMEQYLYPFWTFDAVARLATHIANTGALVECADAWQLPPYLAQDLVKLALFDVMFLLDDSASMRSERSIRPEALKGILRRSADAAGRFDHDGMECAWMNSEVQQRIHTADEANRLADACKFSGNSTPMGSALESKIIVPHVLSKASAGMLQKPALILVITDGRPTGSAERGDKIVQVLKQTKRSLESTRYGEDAVSFQIAAVGNDTDAQEWLDSIDAHPEVGELVDVCSDIRQEAKQVKRSINVELSEELYCLKILLGGIDASYDASDEVGGHAAKNRNRNRAAKEARFASEMAAFRAAKEQALGGGGGGPVPVPGGGASPMAAPPGGGGGGYGQPPQQGYPSSYAPQAGYGAPPPAAASPYGAPPGGGYGGPPQPHIPSYGAPPSSYGGGGGVGSAYGAPSFAGGGGSGGGFPDPSAHMGGAAGAPPPYATMGGGYGDRGAAGMGMGAPQPWSGMPHASPGGGFPGGGEEQQGQGQSFPPGTGGFGMPTPQMGGGGGPPSSSSGGYSSYPPY